MTLTAEGARTMQDLTSANHALNNRAELDRIMAERGYWFFRDVLDRGVVAEMTAIYLDLLKRMGLVDAAATEPIWNGASLASFPDKIEALHDMRLWRDFVSRPEIIAFFEQVLGDRLFWIPSVEYRITPPATASVGDYLTGRHQDGFANYGIPFLTAWVPLTDIPSEVGGLAMAEGLQNGPILHDINDPPLHRIPEGAIPEDVWHRSDYHPGDVVMFSPQIPHSGMANTSNRFRLSMDIRVMGASGHCPAVGSLEHLGDDTVAIRTDAGELATFKLDERTYFRGTTGARRTLAEMQAMYPPGSAMMASEQDGYALLVRPQR